jgi:hypothetical protein
MQNVLKVLGLLSFAVPTLAGAAEPLPKQVSDMDCVVGNWKGTGSLTAGKDKAPIAATWSCKRTSAQYGVMCTFHVTGIPGMQAYEETDLMGYEPNTNTYHWYSVTNAGETHDHVAKPSSSNTIEFVFNGTQDGKAFKEVIDLTFSNDSKTITGSSESFLAGVSTSVMALTLKK